MLRRLASGAALLSLIAAVTIIAPSARDSEFPGRKFFEFTTTINIDNLSIPGKKIFKATSYDGKFFCSAGFVHSVSSRILTNSNQLEFYCRETDKDIELNFQRLAEIENDKSSQSKILYFRDYIIDIYNKKIIDKYNKVTPQETAKWFPDKKIYYISRRYDGSYFFFVENFYIDGKKCSGLSVTDELGTYYGSVLMSSYVSLFQKRVIFDYNGDLHVSEALEPRERCITLTSKNIQRGVGWPYGGVETETGFLLGGSGIPARLYNVGFDLSVRPIPIQAPARFVSELYSYAAMRGSLHVGTFPLGDAVMVPTDPNKPASPAGLFSPEADRWTYPDSGAPYRELQSMVYAYGAMWGGMYPWGEIVVNDQQRGSYQRYRLFTHPQITNKKAPYIDEVRHEIRNFQSGRYDYIPAFSHARRSISQSDELPRELGLFGEAWGQRVPQIVVKNGGLCASTGSMAETPFEPMVHRHLSANEYSEYGAVWCTDLKMQTLADLPRPGTYELVFSVYENGVAITIDGKSVTKWSEVSPEFDVAFGAGKPRIRSRYNVLFSDR